MKTSKFPDTIEELSEELKEHSKIGRSDSGYRLNIALAQMGNIAMHFTHDHKENPLARPYGSRKSEISDMGHAILQIMIYAISRDVDLKESINTALLALRDKDCIKKEPSELRARSKNEIIGKTSVGVFDPTEKKAFVVMDSSELTIPQNPNDYVLVIPHISSDSRITKFFGVITDHGGLNSHASIISREFNKYCIVGCGNATIEIKNGDVIKLHPSVYNEVAIIEILK